MFRLAVAAGMLSLGACAIPSDPGGHFGPTTLTQADVNLAQGTVRASMRDPMSAIFGPVGAAENESGAVVVCGLVNGKNAFGGYTGYQHFYGAFQPGRKVFYVNDIGDAAETYCGLRGLRLQLAPML